MVTDCWRESTAYPPSFCALAFHNVWDDRNIKTAADSFTSGERRSSNPSFACACAPGGLHAELCHAFLAIFVSTNRLVSKIF